MTREHQILEAAKRRNGFSWRSPGGPVYQLPLLAIFCVAVFAPEDVFHRYPLAGQFADMVRRALLGALSIADIRRFADSTDYPQVALLVCALHWAWLPVAAFVQVGIFEFVRMREGYVVWRHSRNGEGRIGWADWKLLLLSAATIPVLLAVATMVPGDWSMAPGLTTRSRLGLGVLLWIIFWLAGMALASSYAFVRIFIDINLRGK